jgi:hypothetical protein
MKTKAYLLKFIIILPLLLQVASCEDILEEQIYSQLAPGNFLTTEAGIDAALGAVYNEFFDRWHEGYRWLMDVFEAGYGYNEGGSFEARYAEIHEQFLLSSISYQPQDSWGDYYTLIRNANIVLDNLESGDFEESFKTVKRAEALALRGYTYSQLYNYFGPTPIFVSSQPEEDKKARATEQEMMARIESDLTEAAAGLPVDQDDWGRITKGGALAMLCKYYLNTKQWDNASSTAQQIMTLGVYELQPTYQDVFDYNNEKNSELIVVIASDPVNAGNNAMQGLTIPNDYPLPPGTSTWAARLYGYDWFVDSFDENDTRNDDFVLGYVNKTGDTVPGYGVDKTLIMFKYGPDPNASGVNGGMDYPVIRYADILMSRAEALNELNGPNQESIDLINMIRSRAGVDPVELVNFASKEELRDHIFQERLWEFYFECKSREDMIRHGTFISSAQARGLSAQDYMVLYPIPQTEIESNPNCEQNQGYN